jgi:hypothetical protein
LECGGSDAALDLKSKFRNNQETRLIQSGVAAAALQILRLRSMLLLPLAFPNAQREEIQVAP